MRWKCPGRAEGTWAGVGTASAQRGLLTQGVTTEGQDRDRSWCVDAGGQWALRPLSLLGVGSCGPISPETWAVRRGDRGPGPLCCPRGLWRWSTRGHVGLCVSQAGEMLSFRNLPRVVRTLGSLVRVPVETGRF